MAVSGYHTTLVILPYLAIDPWQFFPGGGRQGFRHREHMPAIGLFVSIFVLVKPYGDQYFTILGKHYIR